MVPREDFGLRPKNKSPLFLLLNIDLVCTILIAPCDIAQSWSQLSSGKTSCLVLSVFIRDDSASITRSATFATHQYEGVRYYWRGEANQQRRNHPRSGESRTFHLHREKKSVGPCGANSYSWAAWCLLFIIGELNTLTFLILAFLASY